MTRVMEPLAPPTTARSLEPPRPSPQVKVWAIFGVLGLALVTWSWGSWLLSGDLQAAPPGPDRYPFAGIVYLRCLEVVFGAMAIYFLWRWVVKPLIRDRTLGLDGMIILAGFTLWWYDPVANVFAPTFSYNANLLNFGSWVNFVPGWSTPGVERFGEPIVLVGGAYIWWLWGAVLVSCAILRAFRRRWPNMSNLTLFTLLFFIIIPLDFVVEMLVFVLPGVWVYTGVVGDLSLFPGTTHQFPIYEAVLASLWTIGTVLPRWFRDDRGRSFVERGVDELRVPRKAKKVVSFLAILGFLHVVTWGTYNIMWNWLAVKTDTFANAPSYLRGGGFCGEGTPYACPSKTLPLARKGSPLNIGPDDPRLPTDVREEQNIGGPGGNQRY